LLLLLLPCAFVCCLLRVASLDPLNASRKRPLLMLLVMWKRQLMLFDASINLILFDVAADDAAAAAGHATTINYHVYNLQNVYSCRQTQQCVFCNNMQFRRSSLQLRMLSKQKFCMQHGHWRKMQDCIGCLTYDLCAMAQRTLIDAFPSGCCVTPSQCLP
jgi:hypothetical protein